MGRVFVTRTLPREGLAQLEQLHQVEFNLEDRPLSRARLLAVVEQYDAVICLLNDRIDAAIIEAARGRVKICANYAVGYDNIDLVAARKAGIYVSNTPGVLTEATADLAWALLLTAARHIVASHQFTVAGKFAGWHPTQFMGRDFFGSTLGIIGAGRIGQAVARRAAGFGMNIIYYNRSRKPEMESRFNARQVGLKELLQQSDFISVHLPLTAETRHMLGAEQLALLKPTAVLVNTARGAIIEEAALAKALGTKALFAAGLDVYEQEPSIHPELLELDNVVLLPHIGSASWETRLKMAKMAAANVEAVLDGGKPLNPVW